MVISFQKGFCIQLFLQWSVAWSMADR